MNAAAAVAPDIVSAREALRMPPSARVLPSTPPDTFSPPRALALAGLLLGWMSQVLFNDHPLGISLPLFTLASIGALLHLAGPVAQARARGFLWLGPAIVVVSVFPALRDSPELVLLDVSVMVFLTLLLCASLSGIHLLRLRPVQFVFAALSGWLSSLTLPPGLIARSVRWKALEAKAGPLVRGVLLTVPLLLLFGLLFASADASFGRIFERLFVPSGPSLTFGSLVWTPVAAFCFAGLFALSSGLDSRAQPEAIVGGKLGFIEGVVILVALNALFWAFGALQLLHLAADSTLPFRRPGILSSDAREGFFQLLWVTGLVLALLLTLTHQTRRETLKADLVFKALASLLVVLSLVVAWSASHRLSLYEDAFGSTLLRFYSHAFVGLLSLLLGGYLVTLWTRPERFAALALQLSVAVLVAFNVANPEVRIVEKNLAHFEATGGIDVGYLLRLSDDAVPLLLANEERMHKTVPQDRWVNDRYASLHTTWPESEPWFTWNRARSRAHAARIAFPARPESSEP
ncbi:MAG: DUF4173 domain-containing protein [Deltaproteobacteria bacterium]|nr:DUF4173 domain-containing protein [Deltaproteobacteria bacterium]